jgi:putative intracellular protease/amidase
VPDDADHVPVHEVLIPLFDGVQPLDVVGPHEVLAGAGRLVQHRGDGPGYGVSLVAERPGPVAMRRAFLRRRGVPPDHYRCRFPVHN